MAGTACLCRVGARVVEASYEERGQVSAMALGEGTTAEVAENRAAAGQPRCCLRPPCPGASPT